MRFGLMVGPSVNWLNADANDWTSETRTRWSYGLMADFFMTDRYALSSGMTIASRQAHLDISDTVGEYTLGSVDIPLVLKMQTQQFDRMTYFAKFGGGIGFRTRERVELFPIEWKSSIWRTTLHRYKRNSSSVLALNMRRWFISYRTWCRLHHGIERCAER